MAYLGILLLAAATKCESLSYEAVAAAAAGGNALYLKTAFLLILCGYSCKVELFPLYTVGVDANFAAPSPASALISTGLVNAGFLAGILQGRDVVTAGRMGAICGALATQTPGDVEGYPDAAQMEAALTGAAITYR